MLIDSRMVVRQIQKYCMLFLAFPMVICFLYVSKLIRDIGLLSDIPLKPGHLRYSVVRFHFLLKPFVLLDLGDSAPPGEGVHSSLVSWHWGGRGSLLLQSRGRELKKPCPLGLHWYPPGLAERSALLQLSTWSLLTPPWRQPCYCQHESPEPPLGHLFSNPHPASGDEKSAPCWQAVKLGALVTA